MGNSGDDFVITNAGAGQIIEIPQEVLLRNDPGLFVAGIGCVTGASLANGDVTYATPSDFPASDGAFAYQASDGTGLGDSTTVTVSGITGQTGTGTADGDILIAAPAGVAAPATVGAFTDPAGFTMSLTPFGERPTGGTIYVAQTFTAPATAASAQNLHFELGNYAGLSDIEFRVLIVTNDGTGVDLWGRPNFSPGQVLFTSMTLTMHAGASTTEFNVALSGLALNPGQTYAFVLDAIGVTASEGLGTAALLLNNAGYAGGDSYTLNTVTGNQSTDFLANFSPVHDTDLNFEIAFDTPAAGVTLDGQDGDDSLIGASGNDTLLGGGGDDWLFGKAGDDVLQGGANNDRIDAGAGNDRIVYRITDGFDTVDGGSEWSGGGDVLEVRNT